MLYSMGGDFFPTIIKYSEIQNFAVPVLQNIYAIV